MAPDLAAEARRFRGNNLRFAHGLAAGPAFTSFACSPVNWTLANKFPEVDSFAVLVFFSSPFEVDLVLFSP